MKSFSACDIIVTLIIGGFFLMAKKKNVNLTTVIVAALALVALIMMFLPAVSYVNNDKVENFSTFQILFGKNIDTVKAGAFGITVGYTMSFKFSLPVMLACLFILIGLVVSVLNVFGILENKLFGLIIGVLLIVSAVLMLVMVDIAPYIIKYENSDKPSYGKFASLNEAKLGTGAIIAGITAGLAGLVSVWKAAYNK